MDLWLALIFGAGAASTYIVYQLRDKINEYRGGSSIDRLLDAANTVPTTMIMAGEQDGIIVGIGDLKISIDQFSANLGESIGLTVKYMNGDIHYAMSAKQKRRIISMAWDRIGNHLEAVGSSLLLNSSDTHELRSVVHLNLLT
jgi:hypothetical protein